MICASRLYWKLEIEYCRQVTHFCWSCHIWVRVSSILQKFRKHYKYLAKWISRSYECFYHLLAFICLFINSQISIKVIGWNRAKEVDVTTGRVWRSLRLRQGNTTVESKTGGRDGNTEEVVKYFFFTINEMYMIAVEAGFPALRVQSYTILSKIWLNSVILVQNSQMLNVVL